MCIFELYTVIYFLKKSKESYNFTCVFSSSSVSRSMQNILNQFAPNLVEGWVNRQGKNSIKLDADLLKSRCTDFFTV